MTNSKILTAEQVKEIRERCERATAGPWEFVPGVVCDKEYAGYGFVNRVGFGSVCFETEPDALFTAYARQDIPSLLDSHEALEKRVKELESLLAKHDGCSRWGLREVKALTPKD